MNLCGFFFTNLLSFCNLVFYIYVSKIHQLHKYSCSKTGYKLVINNIMFQEVRFDAKRLWPKNNVVKPAYVCKHNVAKREIVGIKNIQIQLFL